MFSSFSFNYKNYL